MGWSIQSNEPLVVGVLGRLSDQEFDVVLYLLLDWEGPDLQLQELFCWTGQENNLQKEFDFASGPQQFRARLLEKLSESAISDRRDALTFEKKIRSLLQQNRARNTLQELIESDTITRTKKFLGQKLLPEVFAGDNHQFKIQIASLPSRPDTTEKKDSDSGNTDNRNSRTYFKIKPALDPMNGVEFNRFDPGDELTVKLDHRKALQKNSQLNKRMSESSKSSNKITSTLVDSEQPNPDSDEVNMIVDLTQDVDNKNEKIYGLGETKAGSRVKTEDPKFDEGMSTFTLILIILGIVSSITVLLAGISIRYPGFFLWLFGG